jgi:hypothetical protein
VEKIDWKQLEENLLQELGGQDDATESVAYGCMLSRPATISDNRTGVSAFGEATVSCTPVGFMMLLSEFAFA